MLAILLQNNCDGFWAWPWPLLLAFLLGALLGWLLKNLFGGKSDAVYKKTCDGLQAELDACRANVSSLQNKVSTASSFAATTKKPVAKKAVKVVAKKSKSKKDDLTKVEGIGPKIQEHFNNGGIYSWDDLSKTAVSRLQELLDKAGPRYKIHNPESWPMQAEMCAKGQWDKLEKWQDEHKGGRV